VNKLRSTDKILVYFSSHNFELPKLQTRTPSGDNAERQQGEQTTGCVFSEQEATNYSSIYTL